MSDVQYIRSKDVERRASWLKRLEWRLEAIAWDCLYWWPLSLTSPETSSRFGGQVAKLIGPRLKQHKTALSNLARAYPDLSSKEHAKLAVDAWENIGQLAGELPHLSKLPPYVENAAIEVLGADILDHVEASEKGAVFVSGHLANWEVMAAAICCRPVDCLVTYRAINNPHIDRRLNRVRHAYGIDLLTPKGLGTRQLMEALDAGRSIAILNDQKFREGIPVPFFGDDAMTAPGAARLALRYDVPMIFVSTRRVSPARFVVDISPLDGETLDVCPSGTAESLTHLITQRIENEIRRSPSQWFWMHNRWPKRAPAD